VVPPAVSHLNWRQFIDTAAAAPGDVYPENDGPAPPHEPILMENHSLRCYVAE
jgi:glycogen operon protein